ncbi:hypothetical protein [Halomonas sp. BC04]|uniref:hypothetical protein n=1 Tax=Halomonas sp. BC04 TaxID=1403540 RepID=UPI0003ED6977
MYGSFWRNIMTHFKKAPIALAIAALLASGYALADRGGNDFETNSSIDSTFTNNIDVSLEHDSNTTTRLYVKGGAWVFGKNYAGSTVDSKQLQDGNVVINDLVENDASVGGNALRGASGNIGVNVASGDNNQQANDAALAASDAQHVFGQASAFSAQSSSNNTAINSGTQNTANLGGNALRGASGNIGANIASGAGNAQQNTLSASVSNNGSAVATGGGVQASSGNVSYNAPGEVETTETSTTVAAGAYASADAKARAGKYRYSEASSKALSGSFAVSNSVTTTVSQMQNNTASIDGNALRGASGNIGANVASGNNNMQRNSLAVAATSSNNAQ